MFAFFPGVQVQEYNTSFSYRKEIRWNSITSAASGTYVCQASAIKDKSTKEQSWNLEIVEPKKPEIVQSNVENDMALKSGEPLQMWCNFSSIPRPKIAWYKDGNVISPGSNDSRVSLKENNTLLDIHFTKDEDEGSYKCVGTNRIGSVSRETKLKITSK